MNFKAREGFKQYIGLIKASVTAVNPTIKQLRELGITVNDAPKYIFSKDSTSHVRVSFKLDSTVGKQDLSFVIKRKESQSKDGKFEFVNSRGERKYFASEDEAKADDRFTKSDTLVVRKAWIGETNLYNFLLTWLKIDRNYDYDILLDRKKLFSGDFSELDSYVGTNDVNEVILAIGTRTYEGKTYSTLFNRAVLGGYYWDSLPEDDDFVGEAQNKFEENKKLEGEDRHKLTMIERFAVDVCDSEYGLLTPHQFKKAVELSEPVEEQTEETKNEVEDVSEDDLPF